MNQQTEDDPNVVELRALSNPMDFGTMLRLAREVELLKSAFLEHRASLWDYLLSLGFQASFIESTAKPYWKRACQIVGEIPYRRVVTLPACGSEYRLMSYLLREVCGKMTQERELTP